MNAMEFFADNVECKMMFGKSVEEIAMETAYQTGIARRADNTLWVLSFFPEFWAFGKELFKLKELRLHQIIVPTVHVGDLIAKVERDYVPF